MSTVNDLSRTEIVRGLQRLQTRLRDRGVTRLAIFGSRARGDHRPDSDLDVLVDIAPDLKFSLIDLVGVSNLISDELGLPANMFMRRSLEPLFATTIQSDIVEVFGD